MAFAGFVGEFKDFSINPIKGLGNAIKSMHKQTREWTKSLRKADKGVKDSTMGKHIKVFSEMGGAFAGMATGIFSAGMDIIGVFIQLLDKMGVFQPLMDAIGLIFQLIGAEALPYMMDALMGLYDVILEMDWSVIGQLIGEFMIWLITEIVTILSSPGFITMVKNFIRAIGMFAKIFMKIIGGLVLFMTLLDIPAFKLAVLALVNIMAFMWGFMHGGPYGLALGIAMATAATAAVGALLFTMAEGGIVTKPTFAMIGEAGPEAVIPLSEGGGMLSNDEVVWAMEDNTARLDMLILTALEQNRLKRMKVL